MALNPLHSLLTITKLKQGSPGLFFCKGILKSLHCCYGNLLPMIRHLLDTL